MFDTLTDKLTAVFTSLGNKGRLTEADVDAALREVRLALLEADVNFKVARDFVDQIREKAVGGDVLKGISPGQQVVKLVHDQLVALLGEGAHPLMPHAAPPSVALMVGLQGSGKTTTAAKLALHLRKQGHRSLLIAADTRRPAAADQLEALGKELDVPVHREEAGPDDAPRVAANGLKRAREMGVAWAIVDTGGRLHVDDELMEELAVMKAALDPAEVLLVVDAMTGQDAVNAAAAFNERIGLTGLVLSKLDGDARGGAALSVTQTTGVPIKFAGVSEKLDGLEVFHPERMASRILGMGDVVTLVERVAEQTTEEQAAEMERKLRRAEFDLDDFLQQLRQLQKMGPLSSLLEMLPGARGLRAQMPAGGLDERRVRRTEAMISSMTRWERQHPERINGSRRRRVAQGSGTAPSDINQLLSQFRQMQKMLKQLASGQRTALGALARLARRRSDLARGAPPSQARALSRAQPRIYSLAPTAGLHRRRRAVTETLGQRPRGLPVRAEPVEVRTKARGAARPSSQTLTRPSRASGRAVQASSQMPPASRLQLTNL